MTDTINHPPHYVGTNGVEAIDVVEGFELGFRLGNALTYILRADRKGEPLRDLAKAKWYLEREIMIRESAELASGWEMVKAPEKPVRKKRKRGAR